VRYLLCSFVFEHSKLFEHSKFALPFFLLGVLTHFATGTSKEEGLTNIHRVAGHGTTRERERALKETIAMWGREYAVHSFLNKVKF